MENLALNYGKGFESENYEDEVDLYVIEEHTHKIYYVKGIMLKGEKYYSTKGMESTSMLNIPPTKPKINIISGTLNEEGKYISSVEIEIVPGKDNISGVKNTQIFITKDNVQLPQQPENNIYIFEQSGTYNIKAFTVNNQNIQSEEVSLDITIEIQ